MPNAVVMTGVGPPDVLQWAEVALPEPAEGQIRIRVRSAGVSPTDLAIRSGHLKAFPLPPRPVLGFDGAGTVAAVGPGVTGTAIGDDVAAFYFALGKNDAYVIADLPDTAAATALSLTINSTGALTGHTTLLITPEEMDAACKKTVGYRPPGA